MIPNMNVSKVYQKKKKCLILIILLFLLFIPNVSYAEESITTDEILEEQQESLNISSFLKEADKYTGSVYEDIDIRELFKSAIAGKIDNGKLSKSLLNAFAG